MRFLNYVLYYMCLYDLHSHSTFSDGVLSPHELIIRAKEKGVDVLALTDHDTVEGLSEAKEQAKISNIKLILGVEISATWKNKLIHIVGLGIDPNNKNLLKSLKFNRELRDIRAAKMAEKLEKEGMVNVLESVQKYAKNVAVTRTHFARYLVDKGYAKDINDVFKKYIVPNKPGFVKMNWIEMEKAIKWIVESGGVAVIAHPGRYKMTGVWLSKLFSDFIKFGGQGIEVAFSTATTNEIKRFTDLALKFDLLASMGSDFHDPKMHWIELGMHKHLDKNLKPVWEGRQW